MIIKREIFTEIRSHLAKKEITFIVGARQVGKTTLMFLLQDYLKSKKENTLFLNLDIENDKQYFTSQRNLIKKIELEFGREKGFVFIDEIQRKENAGLFLKGIYDLGLPYKFIVSGSGSIELKEKIHESLVGRKRIFELSTVTFSEFVNFQTNYKYENNLGNFFVVEKNKSQEFLKDYFSYGGYPRVILEEKLLEKQKTISEIYQSYLEKDITFLLKIKKTESFSNLIRVIASQIGNLINFSELSATLGISTKTIKEYLWYMEKTFIIKKINPYYKNIRKEITKSPMFYFSDLGLRNYSLGKIGNISESQDLGFLFQNLIFNILGEKIKNSSTSINFWRTKDAAEVDFVITQGKNSYPLEVKYQSMEKPEIKRSLKSFIKKYQPQKAYIVNLSLNQSICYGKTKIVFLSFNKLYKNNLL